MLLGWGDLTFLRIFSFDSSKELLPLTAKSLGLKTDIIVDSILRESNFRIWDMNIKGFARELAVRHFLEMAGITIYDPSVAGKPRPEKSDLALLSKQNNFVRFQVKGITLRGSKLDGENSIIDIETQLSRGRVNDHPTQSRLYHFTDFEYLILALDPSYARRTTPRFMERKVQMGILLFPSRYTESTSINTPKE